jgi:hypothetical protein
MPRRISVKDAAEMNGISPATAYNRISNGWTPKDAVSTPPNSSPKADRVWKYLIDNPLAAPKTVAEACDVSLGYAKQLKRKVGTPPEVFEAEMLRDTTTSSDLQKVLQEVRSVRREVHHANQINWKFWIITAAVMAGAIYVGGLFI